MLPASDYALSISEAARTLNKPRSLEDTLQTIVEVACNSVPGFDQVGIATLEKSPKRSRCTPPLPILVRVSKNRRCTSRGTIGRPP